MGETLKGKVVLITGASSGFGADAARLFAREGCRVALAARRLDRLQALAKEIEEMGGEALVVPVDVAQREEVERMVKTVLEVYGQIDILFNNAGFGRLDWLENLDPERDIETQIAVNLTGLILVTRAVLPHMLARRAGHIIHMSSVAGYIAAPLYSVYAATKHGVRGFTDALRREVAPFGVKVSGIYPGPAATEFGQHTGQALKEFKAPSFLRMSSEAVARRVVWLAAHPRRAVILPWYYRLVFLFDSITPGLVDWVLKVAFVQRFHRISP
ncbi:MAG: SDR family oxidoreductase [Anaerolineales bacterium]|nr:SDR family oxidoreductase [Anaerolineales bacterium]MDW8227027.1 SDR family oxidoreductase [Anaerolineales bacterium]